jgi:UDP-2,4-diacetamido-2,4,6-trideoxy-beta-L-altropyranose hydrolase
MRRLLIRADASRNIGSGHVMRCLALAQEWKSNGGSATFLSYTESDSLREQIEAAGIDFLALEQPHPYPADLQTMSSLLRNQSFSHVALDGYNFDPIYQEAVRALGCRTLLIDDYAHQPAYRTDILLNQNLGANTLTYHCDPETVLLLGPTYALLRPEFMIWRGWHREIPAVAQKILITMGGSDPDNVTLKVMQALRQSNVDGLEALVIVGANNPHCQQLEAEARCLSDKEHTDHLSIKLVRNPANMPELMAWADVAVSASGSTCWEMAFMGLPSILLILADNQRIIAAESDKAQTAINLGRFEQATPIQLGNSLTELCHDYDRRLSLCRNGRQLIDGDGSRRVTTIMAGPEQ